MIPSGRTHNAVGTRGRSGSRRRGYRGYIAAVVISALAATTLASPVAAAVTNHPTSGPTARNAPTALTVGTFNVNNGKSGLGTSRARLDAIAAEIHRGDLDVVGLQESATAMRTSLIARLRSTYSYSTFGDPKDRNITGGQIFYRHDVLAPGAIAGRISLPTTGPGLPRTGLYQDFYHRNSGAHFIFVSVHLSNLAGRAASNARYAQAQHLMATLTAANIGGLPIVVAGDMNSNAAKKYVYDAPRKVFRGNGLGEVFDLAARKVNAKFNSFNHLRRVPEVGGYRPDQIYVSGSIGVQYAETMVRLVKRKVKVRTKTKGKIRVKKRVVKLNRTPFISDHSAIRSIVVLPAG